MSEEIRKRRSWLDGFMAYPLPPGVSEAQLRDNIVVLDQFLYNLWNLGENLVFGWTPVARGLSLLVGPHPLLTEFAGGGNDKAFWDGDANVEVTEFIIELALVQVGYGVPAAAVIDGGFGVPLGDLVGSVSISTTGEVIGKLYVKGCGECDMGAG